MEKKKTTHRWEHTPHYVKCIIIISIYEKEQQTHKLVHAVCNSGMTNVRGFPVGSGRTIFFR